MKKSNKNKYEDVYFASPVLGGTAVLKYTKEDLIAKGYNLLDVEDSVKEQLQFEAYFWRKAKALIEVEQKQEKAKNILRKREPKKIVQSNFLKEMGNYFLSVFCVKLDKEFQIKISDKGNLSIYTSDDKKPIVTFFFSKKQFTRKKVVHSICNNKKLYNESEIWDLFWSFKKDRNIVFLDGKELEFEPIEK